MASLRTDTTSLIPRRGLVEPPVVSDLRFSGDAKTIDSFLITMYDIMEANTQCFASDSRKISWVARHFAPGSPALDWWVSQLQENARAHSRAHPTAPCLAGTFLVAGVPFTIPVLLDISVFLRTLAQLFSDRSPGLPIPYYGQVVGYSVQRSVHGSILSCGCIGGHSHGLLSKSFVSCYL